MQIVRRSSLNYTPFFADNPEYLADRAINEQNSPTIGMTYADLRCELTWHLRVDEIFLVLAGRLMVTVEGESAVLEPEESVFCPRETSVTLAPVDDQVRYVAMYYPVNWRELYGEPTAEYQTGR